MFISSFLTIAFQGQCLIYEPVTKGQDPKWDTLPKNQTQIKLFLTISLASGIFEVNISIIKKIFCFKHRLYGYKNGGWTVWDEPNNGHSGCFNKLNNTEIDLFYKLSMTMLFVNCISYQ